MWSLHRDWQGEVIDGSRLEMFENEYTYIYIFINYAYVYIYIYLYLINMHIYICICQSISSHLKEFIMLRHAISAILQSFTRARYMHQQFDTIRFMDPITFACNI